MALKAAEIEQRLVRITEDKITDGEVFSINNVRVAAEKELGLGDRFFIMERDWRMRSRGIINRVLTEAMNSDSGSLTCCETCCEKWKYAETWGEILDLNRDYLQGGADHSPYYSAAIHDDTGSLIPSLLRLHDFGCLTFGSQPARLDGPRLQICQCAGEKHENVWVLIKQRAYLSFLLPNGPDYCNQDELKAFTEALLASDRFHASILSFKEFCKDGCCRVKPKRQTSFPKDWQTHLRKFVGRYSYPLLM